MIEHFLPSLLVSQFNCVAFQTVLITKMAACPGYHHETSHDHRPAFTNDARRSYPADRT
jgi:hypothetical protein